MASEIAVMGAGAIGCYVGGRLASAGADVTLVGRASLGAEIAAHGLTLTDFRGFAAKVAADRVRFATEPEAIARAAIVLVTVKNLDTEATARTLDAVLRPEAVVVSLQNGVRAVKVLRAGLGGRRVLAGMVPFNVVRKAEATFHCGTSGDLVVEAWDGEPLARLVAAARACGLPLHPRADVVAVQWGKLLLNLNNAVNALSGLPLRQQLGQRAYRRVMAATIEEAVHTLARAQLKAVMEMPVPPAFLPKILRAPDVVFRMVAGAMLKIDPEARASMWDDLSRGRRTEIDYLNGEIVALAATLGDEAPINDALVTLVREAEAAGSGSPRLSAQELAARLGLGTV